MPVNSKHAPPCQDGLYSKTAGEYQVFSSDSEDDEANTHSAGPALVLRPCKYGHYSKTAGDVEVFSSDSEDEDACSPPEHGGSAYSGDDAENSTASPAGAKGPATKEITYVPENMWVNPRIRIGGQEPPAQDSRESSLPQGYPEKWHRGDFEEGTTSDNDDKAGASSAQVGAPVQREANALGGQAPSVVVSRPVCSEDTRSDQPHA